MIFLISYDLVCWFSVLFPASVGFCSKNPFLFLCKQKLHQFYLPGKLWPSILTFTSLIHFNFSLVDGEIYESKLSSQMWLCLKPSNKYIKNFHFSNSVLYMIAPDYLPWNIAACVLAKYFFIREYFPQYGRTDWFKT